MEENQENGTTNGSDVPEIELIIKDEFSFTNQALSDEKEKRRHEQQVQNILNQDKENEVRDSIFLTYVIEGTPQNIVFTQLHCDVTGNDGDVEDNNKIEYELVNEGSPRLDVSKMNIEQRKDCNTDSIRGGNRQVFANMVAETCKDEFDVENDLDLNLELEPNSMQSAVICDCRVGAKLKAKNKTKSKAKTKGDSESLQLAVSAVLNDGMSLGAAAKKYSVVKSTIWSRVSKHPKHRRRKVDKELAELIYNKLSDGESLSEISRELNIAKSTVHQHKTRLTRHGRLPPVLLLKKHREGGSSTGVQSRLTQAYRGCRVNGMSVRFAAEFYSVPLTTLWRFIKRRQQSAPQNTLATIETSGERSTDEFSESVPVCNEIKTEDSECFMTVDDSKTELNPEDQQLFEDTYLNHLFE